MAKEDNIEKYPDGTVIKQYPKWVTGADGKKFVVQTKDEEDKLRKDGKLASEGSKPKTAWDK